MTARILILCLAALACPFLAESSEGASNGFLSMYNDQLQGRPTASGELYEVRALTAAHATLPLGTMIRVANFETGRMVDVRVNDRKRNDSSILNLSRAAADHIGLPSTRVAQGSFMVLAAAPTSTSTVPPMAPAPVATGVTGGFVPGDEPARPRFAPFQGLKQKRDPLLDAVNDPGRAFQASTTAAAAPEVKRGLFGRPKATQYGIPASQYEPIRTGNRIQQSAMPLGGTSGQMIQPGDIIPLSAGSPNQVRANVPAMAPAPQIPAAPVASAPYRVQFGAFRKSSNAYEMNGSLVQAGIATTVVQSTANALFLVVTQGGFPTADAAAQWIQYEGSRRGWQERPVVIR